MTEGIGPSVLRRIVAAWPRRAAVARDPQAADRTDPYDPEVPDYPLSVVPFAEHPRFQDASPERRSRVLTGLWLGYNERVVETERLVAEPGFRLLVDGAFPGTSPLLCQAIRQSIVDESYHTYMHWTAHTRTMELRGVRERPPRPTLVTYRRLRAAMDAMPEAWERDIAVLVWSAVAETCVNSLLALVARARDIQPMHSLITTLHLRDEAAHGSILVEVMRELFVHMGREQRAAVARCLPLALDAFAEQDPGVLLAELRAADVAGAEEIVGDLGPGRVVRDFTGARRLVAELGLLDRVDFDFGEQPDWSPLRDPDLRP
ncbi:diiron oxygenase [Saccharothrix violaceirubra]|uniref:Para-aminobenzoate N-oxygenase AurF n=1 Tax=Saccharothrix violaceirubra TaxID=413306 RepID=A0A7W7WXM2_9PSEU|nr:diiron oxygenase [Saccharothrix violaceirubra]MBB4967231.1 hypothetical protein [Saccharothrix violaceirubra]